MEFERIYRVSLPFDKRHPNPSKNYGIGGLVTTFILKGDLGAVQFVVSWPQYLPHIEPRPSLSCFGLHGITGFDVGYHAPSPQYDGQPSMDCDIMGEGQCYYDGSGLQAGEWVEEIFSEKDPEPIIWEKLEAYYRGRFEEATP